MTEVDQALVERYLEHVRVEKRLAERKEKALSVF